MKVSEFIEWLKKQDQDADVIVQIKDTGRYCDDYWEDWYQESFNPDFIGHYWYNKKKKQLIIGG